MYVLQLVLQSRLLPKRKSLLVAYTSVFSEDDVESIRVAGIIFGNGK
jgi:hypothetical protein